MKRKQPDENFDLILKNQTKHGKQTNKFCDADNDQNDCNECTEANSLTTCSAICKKNHQVSFDRHLYHQVKCQRDAKGNRFDNVFPFMCKQHGRDTHANDFWSQIGQEKRDLFLFLFENEELPKEIDLPTMKMIFYELVFTPYGILTLSSHVFTACFQYLAIHENFQDITNLVQEEEEEEDPFLSEKIRLLISHPTCEYKFIVKAILNIYNWLTENKIHLHITYQKILKGFENGFRAQALPTLKKSWKTYWNVMLMNLDISDFVENLNHNMLDVEKKLENLLDLNDNIPTGFRTGQQIPHSYSEYPSPNIDSEYPSPVPDSPFTDFDSSQPQTAFSQQSDSKDHLMQNSKNNGSFHSFSSSSNFSKPILATSKQLPQNATYPMSMQSSSSAFSDDSETY